MLTDIQLLYARIVAAETLCPCACHETGTGFSEQGCHPGGGFNGSDASCQWGCKGKLVVLPLLRETCHKIHDESSESGDEGRLSCIEAGCPGWQAKPLSLEMLLENILLSDKLRDHHDSLPYVALEYNEAEKLWIATLVCGHGPEYEAEAKTLLEALLRALAKAIRVED